MKLIDKYIFFFICIILVSFATIVEHNYGTFNTWHLENQYFNENFGETISDLAAKRTISQLELHKLNLYLSQGRMAYDAVVQSILNVLGHVLACFFVCCLHFTKRRLNYIILAIVATCSLTSSCYEIYHKKKLDNQVLYWLDNRPDN